MNIHFLHYWCDADTFVPTTVILHASVRVWDPEIFTAQPVLSPEGASTQVLAVSIRHRHLSPPVCRALVYCCMPPLILLPLERREKSDIWKRLVGKAISDHSVPADHTPLTGGANSDIIWTGNFFTAKMAQPRIFLSSCPLLRFNGWVESSRTACSWHSPFVETSPCDGPQLRALEVPHHMFPPRITSSCRITETRA